VPSASTLVQRLRAVGSDLPRSFAAQIVALGRGATPLLLGLLDESPVIGENLEPGATEVCTDCGELHNHREWARFHAVDLLTELRDPEAIETMLKVLAGTTPDEPIHDKIVERLPEFGAAALEPTLTFLTQTTKDTEIFESLCCVLSVLGVRDPRILGALLELLTVHPRAGARYLADYGDPAACPAMLAVIAASEADVEDSVERLALLDLLDAYALLGGELPPSVKARIDTWLGG
jgi:hypothetical protein